MDINPSGTSNGRTVVLLHGKNFGGYYWEKPIRFLTAAGHRVVEEVVEEVLTGRGEQDHKWCRWPVEPY
jgi:hypothetical protein